MLDVAGYNLGYKSSAFMGRCKACGGVEYLVVCEWDANLRGDVVLGKEQALVGFEGGRVTIKQD